MSKTGKEIAYHVVLNVKDGKLDEFRELMEKEMAPATFKDEGSIDYSWYVSEDGKEVHIYERYKDVDACLQHSATFAPFGARFMACGDFAGFYVMGDIPNEGAGAGLRAGLAGLGAKFLPKFGNGGFSK